MGTTRYIQCRSCNKLNSAERLKCEKCDATLRVDPNDSAFVRVFPSGYFEHIDLEPVYIKGRKDLLAETRRRGQVSHYAED